MVATPATALGDVQGLGGVAQRVLELLAFGDVGERADGAGRETFGIEQDLAAAGEPAEAAIAQTGNGIRPGTGPPLVMAVLSCSMNEFQILGVHGSQPFVAGEQGVAMGDLQKFEEERGAGDLAGDEIQVEHAEAAGGLREFEELGRAAHLGLALAAAKQRLVQAVGEPLYLVAAGRLRHRPPCRPAPPACPCVLAGG